MSSSDIASLKFASQQITIYIGWSSLIVGLIGNTLNVTVFMTLKTFRQTSCAFYLTAASVLNIVQLLASFFSRILISGYGIDLTKTSLFICKIRLFFITFAVFAWLTCMCLAVADRFASLTIRWRHLCNRRLARRIVLTVIVFWCLYGIPYLIFFNIYVPPATGQPICTNTNSYLVIYASRVQFPVLSGCLPLLIQIVFGVLIWINLHGEAGRRAPIVRLRRDKQLTAMVLIEFAVDILFRMPFIIFTVYSSNISILDPISQTRTELISSITTIFYYSSSTVSFVVYCCASSRFRKQLGHILFHIHVKNFRQKADGPMNNRIAPQFIPWERAPSMVMESVQ